MEFLQTLVIGLSCCYVVTVLAAVCEPEGMARVLAAWRRR
jgi:hypothetical protein